MDDDGLRPIAIVHLSPNSGDLKWVVAEEVLLV